MTLTWSKTNTGQTALINGIPVAQARQAEFFGSVVVTMLLPYDGSERKFLTLDDAQKFIVADVLHTINILLQNVPKHGTYGTYPDNNNIVDD